MSGGRIAFLSLVCVATAGCGQRHGDLRAWMDEIRASEKVSIDPLPVLKSDDLKSPFLDTLEEQRVENVADAGGEGVRPDLNRRKEALEAYPLDALRMVGTLSRASSVWALVQAPDQTISRVSVGNYLGENYGRVTQVEPNALQLVELIANGTGGWMERPASVAIVEQ